MEFPRGRKSARSGLARSTLDGVDDDDARWCEVRVDLAGVEE